MGDCPNLAAANQQTLCRNYADRLSPAERASPGTSLSGMRTRIGRTAIIDARTDRGLTAAGRGEGLTASCCHRGQARPYPRCPTAVPRSRAALCRWESIILLDGDTFLLTPLSNVVAYACRHSRIEDRQMATGQPSSGKSDYGELAHCLRESCARSLMTRRRRAGVLRNAGRSTLAGH
jgi:hypothetical protein